jgi:NAD(P)-dependent dehydrogenase (short-subunit alcohol dehydrogenase family)
LFTRTTLSRSHVNSADVNSGLVIPVKLKIVITGVTRGLGRAMVDEFIRLGHTVFGCARTRRQIASLAHTYPKHHFRVADIASDSQVEAWARSILKKHGAPDFVLNNAAIVNKRAPLWRVSQRDFADEVDINLKGVANVIRHFAPAMIRRRHGVFVNFTSRWGKRYEANMGPYCATKWAVVALTRVLAEELKNHGLAAVGLNPGIVKTGMLKRYLGNNDQFAAVNCKSPAAWAKIAVPYILRLRFSDSGKIRRVSVNQLENSQNQQ